MNARQSPGFALILTLVLLALLVLATYALSALTRVGTQLAHASGCHAIAREHALVGLHTALGELQRLAGADERVSAMAGIAGVPVANERRHWCGVWSDAGQLLGWLISSGQDPRSLASTPDSMILLVGPSTVGSRPASASAYADEEYVEAPLVPVSGLRPDGSVGPTGAFAYWVGDEGTKVSLAPASEAESTPVLPASEPLSIARFAAAFHSVDAANRSKVLCYDQSTNLRYAAGSRLTRSHLRYGFHHLTVAHRSVSAGGGWRTGCVNINTTSSVVWRSILEAYERTPGATVFPTAAHRDTAVDLLAGGIAASSAGKSPQTPYGSIGAFLSSALLESALGGVNGIPAAEFAAAMAASLTVRSDTFRIRAYGAANSPTEPDRIEATAYCEALVQRTPTVIDGTLGRRFVITHFRWLVAEDI